MRSTFYWLVCSAVAVLSMRAAAETQTEEPFLGFWEARLPNADVTEPSRVILLGVGVMAVAYTYRRAWLNRNQGHLP